MKICATILILFWCASIGIAGADSMRDQSVLGKELLNGTAPEVADTPKPVSESFARNLRLSMLFRTSNGLLRAGLVDQVSGKNYILAPDDPQDGLELLTADMDSSQVTIRKNNETVLLKLESGVCRSPPLTEQQIRVLELSKPICVQASDPGPSGAAWGKYLQSLKAAR